MPYAPIKERLQIGNYEVWPYYKDVTSRIENKDVIERLNRLFGCYNERKFEKEKGGYDKPLDEIFIVSPTGLETGFGTLTQDQEDEIRSISHIMAFCAINECAFVTSVADTFILHFYNFDLASSTIRLWHTLFTHLEMVKFMKPYYLPAPLIKFDKTDLCDALGKALERKNRDRIRRVFRTLELFYHTATYHEMMTDEHRLLSLVMCFEVLLNFGGKKTKFADKIKTRIDNYRPQMEPRTVKISNRDADVTHSKTAWWAYDLYDLRSAIIHGKPVNWRLEKYGDIWTRIEFGGVLLRKLVKKALGEEGLWLPDSDEGAREDAILEAEALDNLLAQKLSEFQERRRS
jgi:hypothetical protein